MVNKETLKLLERLKTADGPVSGVALAREFGVSRVALWKRFEALRAAGYGVSADRSGYRLSPGDKPLPWEFSGEETRVFHFETLGSTMDEARNRALAGLREGAVVAERQSAGRGRADRTWDSPGGDLLVTLVLRPKLPVALAGALGLEALATLIDTVTDLYGLPLGLKWPNDLVSGDRKVAGVLVEAWGAVDGPQFYTVGLGLNVHGRPSVDRPVASLESLGRPEADRRALLSGWWSRLSRWAADPQTDPGRWSRLAVTTSSPWTVETFDGATVTGTFHGFDRSGSLLLERTGHSIPIRYGETRRTTGVLP